MVRIKLINNLVKGYFGQNSIYNWNHDAFIQHILVIIKQNNLCISRLPYDLINSNEITGRL